MKSIAPGLRSYLDGHASTGTFGVYLHHAPQSPGEAFFIIDRVSTDHNQTMDDPGDDSLINETFRITAYGRTDEIAHERADAVSTHLADYEGLMGTVRKCEAAYIGDESGDYEPPLYVEGFATADVTILIQHSPAA